MSTEKSSSQIYYDLLLNSVNDLVITDEEMKLLKDKRKELGLTQDQVRALHVQLLAAAIIPFVKDGRLDDGEAEKLDGLYECLDRIGWAPGLKTKAQNALNATTISAISCGITVLACFLVFLVFHFVFSSPTPSPATPSGQIQEEDLGYKVIRDAEDYPYLWELDIELQSDFDKDRAIEITDTITKKYRDRCEKNIIKIYSQDELLATINHEKGSFLNADYSGYIARQNRARLEEEAKAREAKAKADRQKAVKVEAERQKASDRQGQEKRQVTDERIRILEERRNIKPTYVAPAATSSYHSSDYSSYSSGPKTVQVRSYTRKDGTVVRSHSRSSPSRRK